MRHLLSRDRWRPKHSTLWVMMAPVLAMGLVVLLGTAAAPGSFVVNGGSLDTALLVRPDAIFDDLARDVPDKPGVGGRLGTEEPSKVEIPITGTTDGDIQVPHGTDGAVTGIPSSVLPAYQRAATEMAASNPGCGLTWPLLAGIGKVESSHASGGRVDALGNTRGQILGPVLDGGPGMAAIKDTDHGVYDGNTQWDRAVGPMQFIPGTWAVYGKDGNADGVANPHNVYDAARAAGEYLCANGANLRDPRGLVEAVLRYNHSMDYVSTVLRWMETYSKSAVTVNDRTGEVPKTNDRRGNVERDDDPDDVPDDRQTTRPPTTQPTTQPTSRPPTTRPPSTRPSTQPKPPIRTTTFTRPPKPTQPTTTNPPVTSPTKSPNTTTPTPTPTPPVTTPCPTPTPTPTPTEPTPTPTATTPTPTPTPTCAPAGGGSENGGSQNGGTQNGGTGGTQNPAPTTTSAVVDEIEVSRTLMAWAVGIGLLVLAVAILHDRRRRRTP